VLKYEYGTLTAAKLGEMAGSVGVTVTHNLQPTTCNLRHLDLRHLNPQSSTLSSSSFLNP